MPQLSISDSVPSKHLSQLFRQFSLIVYIHEDEKKAMAKWRALTRDHGILSSNTGESEKLFNVSSTFCENLFFFVVVDVTAEKKYV